MTYPQLVIPMTGVSARFTAAGYDRPKFLLETDGQTVIEHVLDMFPGWDDPILICNAVHLDDPHWGLAALIRAKRPRARIVRMEGNSLGPGAAVLHARGEIDRDRAVVVNYCDFTCYWNADDFAERLTAPGIDGLIPAYRGFHPHMAFSTSYAYPKLEDGIVLDIQEKQPWTEDPQSEFASSGTYGFASGARLLDALDRQIERGYDLAGEYYISLTYKSMLEDGARVGVYELQHFMQWGTPQDFEEYRDYSRAFTTWTDGMRTEDAAIPHSRVILASGAGARFVRAGYSTPKPLLTMGGASLLEHVTSRVPGDATVVVTRADLPDTERIVEYARGIGAGVVSLPSLSRGQADSARTGLLVCDARTAVTVAACDAIAAVDPEEYERAVGAIGDDGLAVWLADPYHLASRTPAQFGWARVDEDGRIDDVVLKSAPPGPGYSVIIGTFTFASAESAIRHIDELIADNVTVNGEYYLDSLLPRLRDSGTAVVGLRTSSFISAGTPTEYETASYWQSCFHKWPLHPYELTADPRVPRRRRMDVDHDFRDFSLEEVGLSAFRRS